MKKLIISSLLIAPMLLGSVFGQESSDCSIFFDYSSDANWTQVGTLVEVVNGHVEYINGAPGGSVGSSAVGTQRRVHHPLGTTFNGSDVWTASFDFNPISVGTHSNGEPHVGHILFALTAGTQEPFNDCVDLPCTGFPTGTQDGFMVVFGTDNPADGNTYLMIRAKDGASETVSTRVIANTLNTMYYLTVEKTSSTNIRLNIFTDAARTNHLSGSPVNFAIPSTIEGLNTIQHGVAVRGQIERELTGSVDNLCINYGEFTSVTEKEIGLNLMSVYPNPSENIFNVSNLSDRNMNLIVLNVLGETLKSTSVYAGSNVILDLSDLPSGTYLLSGRDKMTNASLSSKVIIKK